MSSKLFHTIVAVGITLGAAACAAPTEEPSTTDQNAITQADENTGADASAIVDAFCDATWPTTKAGHARPGNYKPACVDPTNACANAGNTFACGTEGEHFCAVSVCIDGAWQCKPGEHRVSPGEACGGDP